MRAACETHTRTTGIHTYFENLYIKSSERWVKDIESFGKFNRLTREALKDLDQSIQPKFPRLLGAGLFYGLEAGVVDVGMFHGFTHGSPFVHHVCFHSLYHR